MGRGGAFFQSPHSPAEARKSPGRSPAVAGGEGPALEAQALDLTRSYTFNETQVLGKRSEEGILRKALAEDLARRVMKRIDTTVPVPQG